MKAPQEAMVAYLATLATIGVLTIAAVLTVIFAPVREGGEGETDLARIIGALAFIGAAVTGLIGVIGTFRPKARDEEPNHDL
jgi:hypothetical protein